VLQCARDAPGKGRLLLTNSKTRRLELRLELLRAENADKPFEFPRGRQVYLRDVDGQVRQTELLWSDQVFEDLAQLASPRPDSSAVQRLGEALRGFVSPLHWLPDEASLKHALHEGQGLDVVLRFSASELYALPWELLTLEGSGQALGELPGCNVRYEWPGTKSALAPSAASSGGRLLFAYSAAGGAVPAALHLRAIRDACERGHWSFDAHRDVLENVSRDSLEQVLQESKEQNLVLHVLCHGGRQGETAGLWWNSPRPGGGPDFVDGASLRRLLGPQASRLRLVVLSACHGGDAGPFGNPLGSVAQALHRVGLPAVVASRLALSQEGSVRLTQTLYASLLVELATLGEAVAAARRHLGRLGEGMAALDWASVQLYAHGGANYRPFVFRPYRGLLTFESRHQRFFFGRDALKELLVRRVLEASVSALPRLQVVAGVSGSGKSSLVMAGLVPALVDVGWGCSSIRPGDAGALEGVTRLRAERPGFKRLLVVDQFKEVFTRLAKEERLEFVQALWGLSRDEDAGVVVLATLRVDDMGRCAELRVDPGLRLDAILYDEAYRVFVSPPAPVELSAAIEGPARRVGLGLEAGLLERLMTDVGDEPGALPLLEFALDLLWQQREGDVLTHPAYQRIGGVTGALVQTVEQLFEGFSLREQQEARRLLVAMVAFQEGSEEYTRRRARQSSLRSKAGESQVAFDAVLEKLVASRLLVRGGAAVDGGESLGWIEFAHEELLRRWTRLKDWIQEDKERVLKLREVETWAEAWLAHLEDSDGGASYLLVGNRLGYARSLQERFASELGSLGHRFVETSWQQHERALRRRRRGLFLALLGAAGVAGVMVFLALIARGRERVAQQQRERARSLAATLQAERLSETDPTLANLLLREAVHGQDDAWTQAALDSLQKPVSQAVLVGHGGFVHSAVFSPDAMHVVTASEDGTARVWRTDGKGEPVVLKGHLDPVMNAGFSPDGRFVVTASRDKTARIWRWDSPGTEVTLRGHDDAVLTAEFSPDGTQVVTASEDGTARVWRADGQGTDRKSVV